MYKFKDAKQYEFVFRNQGLHPEAGEDSKPVLVSMKDALASPDTAQFLPVVVENYLREAIEPMLVGTNMLQRINYKSGTTISLPSVGALTAEDIPEGAEYPEKQLNIGTGVQIATIGKSGLAVKITEETRRYNQYDIFGLNIRAAGRALARHKEQKIWRMLSAVGKVMFDNVTPGSSVYGPTTGRAIDGSANGSINMDDIHKAYGRMLMAGYVPDTLVVHPLTWTMWLSDPVMRTIALATGNISMWYNGFSGNPQNTSPWAQGIMGKLGPNVTGQTEFNYNGNGAPKLPNYLGIPLSVVVSPFVPYNVQTELTDVYLVDSANMGLNIVDEDPTMDEIEDRLRDLVKIKIRERYVIAPIDEGNGIGVFKNVKVTPNMVALPSVAQGPATLADITKATQVLNANGTIHTP